jgi:hypothetical protein
MVQWRYKDAIRLWGKVPSEEQVAYYSKRETMNTR